MSEASDTAKVAIVNRALVKLGLPPRFALDTQDELGGTIDLVWPGTTAKVLSVYDFSNGRQTFPCQALGTTPENGWQYGFVLPATRIGDPLAVLWQVSPAEAYLRDFMLEGGRLYTNVSPVWVRCRVALDPQYWDIAFAEAFATALAADLAVPLLQDQDLGADKAAEAFGPPQQGFQGGLFGRLIAINRAAQPQGRRFLDDDPLTAARSM